MNIPSEKNQESKHKNKYKNIISSDSSNSIKIKNLKGVNSSKNFVVSPLSFLKHRIMFSNSTTMDLWQRNTIGEEFEVTSENLETIMEFDSSIISTLYNSIIDNKNKNQKNQKTVIGKEEAWLNGETEEWEHSLIKTKFSSFALDTNFKNESNVKMKLIPNMNGEIDNRILPISELRKISADLFTSISKINSPYNPCLINSSHHYISCNISEFSYFTCIYDSDEYNEAINFKIIGIFPYVKFNFIRIANFPILSTEYSKHLLTKENPSNKTKESFGYITLNLDQKAMLVSPNSRYSKDCSLVGIWVYLNSNFPKDISLEQKTKILNNQLVISSLLRFLFSTEFRIKASPSDDKSTYLLILISGQNLTTHFFEFRLKSTEGNKKLENQWIVKEKLLSAAKDSNEKFNSIHFFLRINPNEPKESKDRRVYSFLHYFNLSESQNINIESSHNNQIKEFKIPNKDNSVILREKKINSLQNKENRALKFITKGKHVINNLENSMIDPNKLGSPLMENSSLFKFKKIKITHGNNSNYNNEDNDRCNKIRPKAYHSRNLCVNTFQPIIIESCPGSTKTLFQNDKFKFNKNGDDNFIHKSVSSPCSNLLLQMQNSKMEKMSKRITLLEKAIKLMASRKLNNESHDCSKKAIGNLNDLIKTLQDNITIDNQYKEEIEEKNHNSRQNKKLQNMSQIDYQNMSSILDEANENDLSKNCEKNYKIRRQESENIAKKTSPIRKLKPSQKDENYCKVNEKENQKEGRNQKTISNRRNIENSRNILPKFMLNENDPKLINLPCDRIRSLSNLSLINNSKINESVLNCSKITKASENALEKMDNKPVFKLMDIITKGTSDWSFQVPKIIYNEETEQSQNTINSIVE